MPHVITIPSFNYASLLLAAVVTFALGWAWYSVLFGKLWMKLTGVKCDKKLKAQQMLLTMGTGFAANVLKLGVLQFVLIGMHALALPEAVKVAVLLWLGFTATCEIGAVLWEKKPVQLFFINAGFELVAFVLAAIIFVVV